MKDDLGDRMKNNYENRTRFSLPRRTYTIIRLDGKAFHTYTKGLIKPFDERLRIDLKDAVIQILPQMQGVVFAYIQSDEVNILLTDFASPQTDAWYDGNVQKITSVCASLLTAAFNRYRLWRVSVTSDTAGNPKSILDIPLAHFDARVFTIPDRIEVMNYFIWRNNDSARNSISAIAQANFSHTELQGKTCDEMQEMLFQRKAINWAEYDPALKNGVLIVKAVTTKSLTRVVNGVEIKEDVTCSTWIAKPAWKFVGYKEELLAMIPKYE